MGFHGRNILTFGGAAIETELYSSPEEQVGEIFDLSEMKVRILSPGDGYSDIEQLALMAKFRRIVVANSSYSWWAARLSHENPKVVAPYNWYKSMKQPNDLIPDDWIQVKNKWL